MGDEPNLREELPKINVLVSEDQIRIRGLYATPQNVNSKHRVLVTSHVPLSPLLNYSHAFHQRFSVIQCGTVDGAAFYEAIHNPDRVASLRRSLLRRHVGALSL